MKKILIVFSILLMASCLFGQDIIFKTDGTKIQAKVIEISPEFIKYKRFDFQDGPLYSLQVAHVTRIVYQNGMQELFNQSGIPQQPEIEEYPEIEPNEPSRLLDNPVPPATPPVEDAKEKKKEPPKDNNESPDVIGEYPVLRSGNDYSGFLFGLTAGVNAATRFFDYKVGTNPPPESFRIAPCGGIVLGYQFGKAFSIQSNLLYQGKGDKINMADWLSTFEFPPTINATWTAEASGFITTTMHYVEASLLPVISFGQPDQSQFQIGAGPFLGIGISGKEKKDYSITYYLDYYYDSEDIVNEERDIQFEALNLGYSNEQTIYYNQIDYGLFLFAGTRFNNFNFGLSFSWGMAELEPENFSLFGISNKREVISKTATLSFTFTYLFSR